MPTAVSITTFASTAPPWSLAALDANLSGLQTAVANANNYSNYLVDTGSANAYVVTFGAGIGVSLAAGLTVTFKIANSNTGASTLNVSSTGAKPIVRQDGTALVGGELVAGGIATVVYEATAASYILLSVNTPALGYVNGLVNGGMELWQRGTSVGVGASANGYTADRFTLTTNANQASTVSQQTGLTNGSQFCARVQRNNGQTGTSAMVFEQPFELGEIIKYRGQKITVSFVASTGANWSPTSGTLTMIIACGTGAAGRRGTSAYTSETAVLTLNQNIAAGSSAASFVATASAVVPTNTTQMTLYFTWSPTGTAGANDWFQLDDVMWAVGLSPAPFERRIVPAELALATRYYETGRLSCNVSDGITTGTYGLPVQFKVTKRTAPTMVFSNVSTSNTGSGGASNITTQSFRWDVGVSAPNFGRTDDWSADAEL